MHFKKGIMPVIFAVVFVFSSNTFAFSDVSESGVFSTAVNALTELKIIEGYDDDTFRLQANVTRAEMAAFIRRTMNEKNEIGNIGGYSLTSEGTYTDIKTDYWALEPIILLSKLGIICGYGNGTFVPDGNVTYNEAVKMLVCDLNYGYEADENGGYPQGYIASAKRLGILENITQTDYYQPATRGDIAVMIYNSLDIPRALVSEYSIKNGSSYIISENNTIRNVLKGENTITERGISVPSDGIRFAEEIHRMSDQTLIHVSNAGGKSNIRIDDNQDKITIYFDEIQSGMDYYVHLYMLDDEVTHDEHWKNIGPITTDTFTIGDIPQGYSYQLRMSSSPSYTNMTGRVAVN